MYPLLGIWSDWALLVLRVVLGVIFLVHGIPKIKNLAGTAEWLGSAGFKPGKLWAAAVSLVEVGGGVLLILGVFTQLVALLLAGQFLTILVWRVRTKAAFKGVVELDLIIFAALLIILTEGPGVLSLQRIFFGVY